MTAVTRFAPSPTGRLHLGHAYSALFAAERGDRFLLRIEDIDRGRCRPEFEEGIYEDLAWLGLEWERPVRRQSEHLADHAAALAGLDASGLLYPCFCTRKEIGAAGSAPHGPEGAVYPGTCRKLSEDERGARIAADRPYALRFVETDTVLARKGMPTGYHIAVVVDDAAQGVTLVTRGEDLAFARPLHERLRALLVCRRRLTGITAYRRMRTAGVSREGRTADPGGPAGSRRNPGGHTSTHTYWMG